jgi:hypothetical protein
VGFKDLDGAIDGMKESSFDRLANFKSTSDGKERDWSDERLR